MGFVQKYDIKISDRGAVRIKIENHLDEVIQDLEVEKLLGECGNFGSKSMYLLEVILFLQNVGIMSARDSARYVKKIEDLMKEHIYLCM